MASAKEFFVSTTKLVTKLSQSITKGVSTGFQANWYENKPSTVILLSGDGGDGKTAMIKEIWSASNPLWILKTYYRKIG